MVSGERMVEPGYKLSSESRAGDGELLRLGASANTGAFVSATASHPASTIAMILLTRLNYQAPPILIDSTLRPTP